MAAKRVGEQRPLPPVLLSNSSSLCALHCSSLLLNSTPHQCDPGVGVDRFFHAIYTQPSTRMVMLLGSACSEVTESLAKVVPYWNIVQVSGFIVIVSD